MAQILDPLPSESTELALCCYVNATSKIQIARITNVPDWYFERVVFPGQRLIFEAMPKALLEIHTGMMASAILSDTIPCNRLILEQEEEVGGTNPPTMPSTAPPVSISSPSATASSVSRDIADVGGVSAHISGVGAASAVAMAPPV